ncbi:Crp/Fnr family transcriptional regulator [Aquirufa sp. ROCK2-A2]
MTTNTTEPQALSTRTLFSILALSEITPLSKGLKVFLSQKIQQVNYKRGEIFCREGEICNRFFLLKKGAARGFLNFQKSEITNWLCLEKEFVICFDSFFKNEPSKENFQALEDCYFDYLELDDLRYGMTHFPEMEILYRSILEKYYMASHDREFVFRITNATERFKYFKEHFNNALLEKIPAKYLASYLGMRAETYCRITKE